MHFPRACHRGTEQHVHLGPLAVAAISFALAFVVGPTAPGAAASLLFVTTGAFVFAIRHNEW
jgi:hypothetical protein